jgi:hypothetical protein
MDQEPLVTEQIDAGKKFLDAFKKYVPVRVAFWLKPDEDIDWYLHIASDKISFESLPRDYTDVWQATREVDDPNFDPFRVRLIRSDDPLARAALDIYRRYPASRIPTRIQGRSFGGTNVEGVYIYPPPTTVSSP